MNIILCADDYGQNTAISQAIIELLKKNRLSATSCMTNSYYWSSHSKWLRPLAEQADIGLHFNLTEGKLLSKKLKKTSLSKLILKAYLGKLNATAIEGELNAQLDAFIAGIGRAPDFLDGHQHVQQLPIIRDVFLKVYEQRLRATGCYIRSVKNNQIWWRVMASGYIKALIIQLCGAFAFNKKLAKQLIPHNSSFAGFYDFAKAKKYPALFPRFLRQLKSNGMIMCHPGLKSASEEDAIADARFFEYQYLVSDQFAELMAAQRVVLRRFEPNG